MAIMLVCSLTMPVSRLLFYSRVVVKIQILCIEFHFPLFSQVWAKATYLQLRANQVPWVLNEVHVRVKPGWGLLAAVQMATWAECLPLWKTSVLPHEELWCTILTTNAHFTITGKSGSPFGGQAAGMGAEKMNTKYGKQLLLPVTSVCYFCSTSAIVVLRFLSFRHWRVTVWWAAGPCWDEWSRRLWCVMVRSSIISCQSRSLRPWLSSHYFLRFW